MELLGSADRVHEWIDVSVMLRPGLVSWPQDPPLRMARAMEMSRGDPCNITTLDMAAHTGTHMDGPRHFIADGAGLDEMPLSAVMGPARVIEIEDPSTINPEELEKQAIRQGERLLFKTKNSDEPWDRKPFQRTFVHFSVEGARYLADRGVTTVGIDYLSVGGMDESGDTVHRVLLGAGIWIIEGLWLGDVAPGEYDLICLPLKIFQSDGAPARAVIRKRG